MIRAYILPTYFQKPVFQDSGRDFLKIQKTSTTTANAITVNMMTLLPKEAMCFGIEAGAVPSKRTEEVAAETPELPATGRIFVDDTFENGVATEVKSVKVSRCEVDEGGRAW